MSSSESSLQKSVSKHAITKIGCWICLLAQANTLWLMLHGITIDNCDFKAFDNSFVNGITLLSLAVTYKQFGGETTYKVLHSTPSLPQHNGGRIIGKLSLRLRIHSYEIQFLPPIQKSARNPGNDYCVNTRCCCRNKSGSMGLISKNPNTRSNYKSGSMAEDGTMR